MRAACAACRAAGEPPTALSTFATNVMCSISSMKMLRTTSAAAGLASLADGVQGAQVGRERGVLELDRPLQMLAQHFGRIDGHRAAT